MIIMGSIIVLNPSDESSLLLTSYVIKNQKKKIGIIDFNLDYSAQQISEKFFHVDYIKYDTYSGELPRFNENYTSKMFLKELKQKYDMTFIIIDVLGYYNYLFARNMNLIKSIVCTYHIGIHIGRMVKKLSEKTGVLNRCFIILKESDSLSSYKNLEAMESLTDKYNCVFLLEPVSVQNTVVKLKWYGFFEDYLYDKGTTKFCNNCLTEICKAV